MINILRVFVPIIDFILIPFVFLAGAMLLLVRKIGFHRLKRCKEVLLGIQVYPLINHYYEPLFLKKLLKKPIFTERAIPGIDLNIDEQLSLLDKFQYYRELKEIPLDCSGQGYYYNNGSFESGDSEYLYNMIRHFKPKKIIEVGSGYSTLMAIEAIKKNKEQDPFYSCDITCIEPYESPWLEDLPVKTVRDCVESIGLSTFTSLEKEDILFIDSSHIIRPQGDVLYEIIDILPQLKKGVLVHIHDIFTPRDYKETCFDGNIMLWNEQYLLEALLSCSQKFKIIGAVNYLKHSYFDQLSLKCPIITQDREPGSFWIKVDQ